MRTALEQRLLETIRRERMLAPGDRVGVAVSGGADSVALLRLLERLRRSLGVVLVVLHFDHALRGAESDADAQFVEDLARNLGLEFIVEREDVAAAAERRRWNIEDAARRLRYGFFGRMVSANRVTRIAVAHTSDDQAETVLARLIRGAGPAGLAGIYPLAGPVVRPFLWTRREELREYLRALGQGWREDSTNGDLHRQRARIRAQLLPVLERDFSARIVVRLGELARLSREEELFWATLVEDRFRALVRTQGESFAVSVYSLISPMELSSPPNADAHSNIPAPQPLRSLTERLIRRLYERTKGDRRELAAEHVEQVIRLAAGLPGDRSVTLPGGIVVERAFDDLIFARWRPDDSRSEPGETHSQLNTYQYVVTLPDRGLVTVSVPELRSCFRLKVIDWPLAERDTKRGTIALDAHLLRTPLVLRNWRAGDAYRPHGRHAVKKIKGMFLAGRVPRADRACWPVLESGGSVIWARGMPPADGYCASESTRAGVLIEEDRL